MNQKGPVYLEFNGPGLHLNPKNPVYIWIKRVWFTFEPKVSSLNLNKKVQFTFESKGSGLHFNQKGPVYIWIKRFQFTFHSKRSSLHLNQKTRYWPDLYPSLQMNTRQMTHSVRILSLCSQCIQSVYSKPHQEGNAKKKIIWYMTKIYPSLITFCAWWVWKWI